MKHLSKPMKQTATDDPPLPATILTTDLLEQ